VKTIFRFVAMILLAGMAGAQPVLRMKAFRRDADPRTSAADAPQKTRSAGRSHRIVQFADTPVADQLTELQNRGATILSYIPDFAYSISAADDASFDGLNVSWVGHLRPAEKLSPDLEDSLTSGVGLSVIVEFYSDVDPGNLRGIANDAGLVIQENPDLNATHLLVSGSADQVLGLADWDEVAYIFPASVELIDGTPVRACAGALTSQGQVTQSIPLVGEGWDGPGLGGADLKYAFVHMTEKLPADSAQAEIVRAFAEWAKYAKLTFSPTATVTGPRTIAVLFAGGAHGDPYPFDGSGGALAHTFYPFPVNAEPIAGDMHFDNDESWRIGTDIDLFSIALHETGHALGLGHSDKPGDVMYPYYRQTVGLSPNDIAAVLQLYAAQDGTSSPAPSPAPAPAPPTNPLTLTIQTPGSPTVASSAALSGTTAGGSGAIQVSWSSNGGYSGGALGSAAWTISGIPLNIGDNIVIITATDSKQNRATRTLTITRQSAPAPSPAGPDTTPPSLTVVSPSTTSPSTSSSSMIVSGTARDNVGVTAVTWTSSNGGSGTATGTINWTTPAIPLYIGSTTITIRASDAAGNTSWRSLTVTRR
jgi:hypothetical protein